jgi:hypothetical protein
MNLKSQEIVTGRIGRLGALVHPIVMGSEPINNYVTVPIIIKPMMIASVKILLSLNPNLVILNVTLIKKLFNIGKNINPGQYRKTLTSNVLLELHSITPK